MPKGLASTEQAWFRNWGTGQLKLPLYPEWASFWARSEPIVSLFWPKTAIDGFSRSQEFSHELARVVVSKDYPMLSNA
jgi:hypothetical protein